MGNLHYLCIMKIKRILIAIVVLLLLVIYALCTNLIQVHKHLKDAEEMIEIQHEIIEKLGAMDAVNATINIEVNNRATFGKVTAGDVEVVADQVLRYTRKQLLECDTLCKN